MGGFGRELQHVAATRETVNPSNIRRKNLPGAVREVNVAFLLLTGELSTETRRRPRGANLLTNGVECWHDCSGSARHLGLPDVQKTAAAQGNRRKLEMHRMPSGLPGSGQHSHFARG